MSCVFVHAGAGYHSKENERNHLQACSEYVETFPQFSHVGLLLTFSAPVNQQC
jgi:taspase (threonine aspartase 1)